MSPFAASLAAPLAGVVAGLAGQYADFRSLRALILLAVGLGVLATAWAATRHADNVRTIAVAAAIGATAWGGGQVMYVILHIASGEPFDMDMFDAQWEQAIALTVAHAAFLGVPTGLVAGLLLTGWRTFARRRS
jgi:hypothetical protein